MPIDPISIEFAFDRLSGNEIVTRGSLHDADIFRYGTINDLGKVLEEAADALNRRIENLPFTDAEKEGGGPEPRLRVEIDKLRRIAQQLKKRDGREDLIYHWDVIGCFVDSVAALLEMFEARS